MSDKITMTLDEFRMAIRAENVRAAIKMREACVARAKEWFPGTSEQSYTSGGVVASIAAITVDEVLG